MSNALQRPNRFFDFYNTLEDFFSDITPSTFLPNKSFKIDVRENEKEYMIDAELPGVKKEGVDLKLADGTLTISVQQQENTEENQESYIHRERKYGFMQRSFNLPNAAEEGATANFSEGLLHISIPKENKPDKSTKIEIQ